MAGTAAAPQVTGRGSSCGAPGSGIRELSHGPGETEALLLNPSSFRRVRPKKDIRKSASTTEMIRRAQVQRFAFRAETTPTQQDAPIVP
jgi:hypothetical protein